MAQDKQELMDYILDHYEDPRNSGTITDADKVQNSVCLINVGCCSKNERICLFVICKTIFIILPFSL